MEHILIVYTMRFRLSGNVEWGIPLNLLTSSCSDMVHSLHQAIEFADDKIDLKYCACNIVYVSLVGSNDHFAHGLNANLHHNIIS